MTTTMMLTLRMKMPEQKHRIACQTSRKRMVRSPRPSLMISKTWNVPRLAKRRQIVVIAIWPSMVEYGSMATTPPAARERKDSWVRICSFTAS